MLKAVLQFALERKRPHGGRGEEQLATFIESMFRGKTSRDEIGNVHLDLRGSYGSRTLFVAHMDTVHRKDGVNKILKIGNKWYGWGDPLGADDGAGVAMLAHLAHHGVPGYYIFTRGEEVGGIGATWLAENMEALLSNFDRAIAFDRRGIDSVITEQGFVGPCASDEFADALAAELNEHDLWYLADNTGVYTDTAEFIKIIPECTNISVGYEHEHSDREMLDMNHFRNLAKAALKVKWDELPTKRDPKAPVEPSWMKYSTGVHSGGYGIEIEEGDEWDLGVTPGFTQPLRHELMDALDAADMGRPRHLHELMAYQLHSPEEANTIMDSIHNVKIPHQLIDRAWDRLDSQSAMEVLTWLYDKAIMAQV